MSGSYTIGEAREIQIQTSGRAPQYTLQGGAAISAPNGVPALLADGVLTQGPSGRACVEANIKIRPDDSDSSPATAYSIRLWAYSSELAAWYAIHGARFEGLEDAWTEYVRCGSDAAIYVEVLATDGDLLVHVGPVYG